MCLFSRLILFSYQAVTNLFIDQTYAGDSAMEHLRLYIRIQ